MRTQKRSGAASLAVGVLVLALGMTACSKDAEEPVETNSTTAVVAGSTIELNETSSGTTQQAAQGDKVVLKLTSNASTGYSWKVIEEPDAAVLKLDASNYEEPESGVIGASGSQVWTFTAVGPGTTTLKLEYVPPGKGDGETMGYSVTVEVA